ncbi:MAG: hypothetical protein ACP5O2_12570 [Bacteroidales bacterium]
MFKTFRRNFANLIGAYVPRKIVVFESDDWGSVRTYNAEAYHQMSQRGLNVDHNHYGNDSLESNEDLEMLFDVLSSFKDSTGRHPVFTPFCCMANPDFDKIAADNYQTYFYQSLEDTVKYYENHSRLLELWRKGKESRLFCPQLHAREHLNVRRWMEMLNWPDGGLKFAASLKSVGVSANGNVKYKNYLGALHPESSDEIPQLHQIVEDAGNLYNKYLGHRPTCFVAPNAEEPKELESTIKKIGIQSITRAKIRKYPLGDGKFKTEFNWFGKVNSHGQIILVRNAFFEPVCYGEPDKAHISDWVDHCMKNISIAFRWKKPAVISTHRVNYIGHINPQNREKGIKELRRLLHSILKQWPDVEFMTSEELAYTLRS